MYLHYPPNSESVVWVKVPDTAFPGIQGMGTGCKNINHTNLLVAKTLVTVSSDLNVPLKIMNPTNETIVVKRNFPLAVFESLQGPYQVIQPFTSHSATDNVSINHVHQAVVQTDTGVPSQSNPNSPDFIKFASYFNFSTSDLTTEQESQMKQL